MFIFEHFYQHVFDRNLDLNITLLPIWGRRWSHNSAHWTPSPSPPSLSSVLTTLVWWWYSFVSWSWLWWWWWWWLWWWSVWDVQQEAARYILLLIAPYLQQISLLPVFQSFIFVFRPYTDYRIFQACALVWDHSWCRLYLPAIMIGWKLHIIDIGSRLWQFFCKCFFFIF